MTSHRAGRLSRRELLVGTVMVTGGAAVAGPEPAGADDVGDASLLSSALRFERLSVLAYEHVLALPAVTSTARPLLAELLGHERAHVQVLEQELSALGAPLPQAPTRPSQVDDALSAHDMSADLTTAKTLKDAVQALLDIGSLCEGAYYTAAGKLTRSRPLIRVVQALASEGQHGTLLSRLIHTDPRDINQWVPAWYVAGVT